MKKIKRIAPSKLKTTWDVRFRPTTSGVAIDITLVRPVGPAGPISGLPRFDLLRSSYLIPWQQIDAWSKAPRGKLISVPNHLSKKYKHK